MKPPSCKPRIVGCTYKQCLDCNEVKRCCGWICAQCSERNKKHFRYQTRYQTDEEYREEEKERRRRYYYSDKGENL